VVLLRVWESGWSFVSRAGTLIFATSVLVWAAGSFPGDHGPRDQLLAEIESVSESVSDEDAVRLDELTERLNQANAQLLENSLLGRTGRWVEPVFRPLGWDWKIGVGVLASFPAREVIIATLGTIYSLGGDVDEEDEGLRGVIRSASWPDGRPVFTIASGLSIMVFFALCAQCVSTLMVIRRETNSWQWPVFCFVYMTALAYAGSWITFVVASNF
jgi:ferrous iron transport protein B